MNMARRRKYEQYEREKEQVLALLKAQQRSMSWLATAVGTNRQSVQQWLVGETKPRDPAMWEKMRLALIGKAMALGDLDKPKIPVGFGMTQMRFAGEVPCAAEWGDPLSSDEFIEVEVQYEHPRRFAAKVVGNSCYPALRPGDITIWHSDTNPPYGLIVLAQQSGDHGVTVKQLDYEEKGQRPVLNPVNPASGKPEDGDGWGVIGRLVAVIRVEDGLRKSWYMESGMRPKHLV